MLRKASPRPSRIVVVRRSPAPFSHSLLCGVSLRKNATLWPFHLLTPAPSQEILKRGFGHSWEVGCSFFAHFRGRAKRGRPYTTRKRSKRQKVHPLGGFFGMSGVRRGPFLPRKASPRPSRIVVVRRSPAPFSHSLLCGVSLRKNATLWPFHLLTPAPPKEILKEEIAVAGKKRSKRQKSTRWGAFFAFRPKCP